jgi:hypothetical protein
MTGQMCAWIERLTPSKLQFTWQRWSMSIKVKSSKTRTTSAVHLPDVVNAAIEAAVD